MTARFGSCCALLSMIMLLLQVIAAAKKRGQEKAKLTKSMIVMDVKPWDDTTGTTNMHIRAC